MPAEESTLAQIRSLLGDEDLNVVISDISPRLTGRYDTDQAISTSRLSTTVLDVAIDVLMPEHVRNQDIPRYGIEGLVEAAKIDSNVQRFAPTASRNSSSETYLIHGNKLPSARRGRRKNGNATGLRPS